MAARFDLSGPVAVKIYTRGEIYQEIEDDEPITFRDSYKKQYRL